MRVPLPRIADAAPHKSRHHDGTTRRLSSGMAGAPRYHDPATTMATSGNALDDCLTDGRRVGRPRPKDGNPGERRRRCHGDRPRGGERPAHAGTLAMGFGCGASVLAPQGGSMGRSCLPKGAEVEVPPAPSPLPSREHGPGCPKSGTRKRKWWGCCPRCFRTPLARRHTPAHDGAAGFRRRRSAAAV